MRAARRGHRPRKWLGFASHLAVFRGNWLGFASHLAVFRGNRLGFASQSAVFAATGLGLPRNRPSSRQTARPVASQARTLRVARVHPHA